MPPPNTKLGSPQTWSGQCGEEKNLLHLPGTEPCSLQPSHYTDCALSVILSIRPSLYKAVNCFYYVAHKLPFRISILAPCI